MKNTKFWLGFLLGMVITLIGSMGFMYWYVIKQIESTKTETRNEFKAIKEDWDKYLKEDYKNLKKNTYEYLKDKASDFQKDRMDADSLKTE